MKKRVIALTMLICILSTLLLSCKKDPTPMTANGDFSESLGNFSKELLKRTLDDSDENAILSPISVMIALTMLENGAENKSLEEIEGVFGLTREEQNNFLGSYLESLPASDIVKIANSIWIRQEYDVKPPFIDKNRDVFFAEVYERPFDESTCDEINKWVEKSTDKMIKEMLDEISIDTVLYLINTVLFDGKWEEPYESDNIPIRDFTTVSGVKKQVETMYFEISSYFECNGAKGFTKPYKGDRYSFVGILPGEGETLSDYLEGLSFSELVGCIKNQKLGSAEISIPLFSYESKALLNDILKDMGIVTVFKQRDPEKDLSGISDSPDLYVSRVIHAARIELTNEGTKAAGATIVEVNDENAHIPDVFIYLDRPFVYMIYDTVTEVPLFIGAVNDIGE